MSITMDIKRSLPLRILRVVLPDGVELPASRNRAHGAGISRNPQRAPVGEGAAVASALRPPVQGRVDQGPAARQALVRRHEVLDPRHHGALRQAVARVAAGVVLDVQRAGERDAVLGPAAAVVGEVVGLRRARRGRRLGEVVGASDEACRRGAVILGPEFAALVCGTLGSLCIVSHVNFVCR